MFLVVYFLFFYGVSTAGDQVDRQPRLFNVLQIVKFPNDPCTVDSTSGVCFTSIECSALGGTAKATCASGFGVCCTFTVGCGRTVSINNTYFSSNGNEESPCRTSVCRTNDNICQIRLDFEEFDIAGPVTAGDVSHNTNCYDATFTASSDGKKSGTTICGTNTGQHMILEAEPNCNRLEFNWYTGTPSWNIKISQLECDVRWRARSGCTQWYTGVTGTLQSYNFAGGRHLANQDYSICIREEAGYCNIGISLGATDAVDTSTTANTHSAVGHGFCTADFITIPTGGATAGAANNHNVFCGAFLNPATGATAQATVFSSRTPFQIHVKFGSSEVFSTANPAQDETDATNPTNIGFQIQYVQTSC